MIYLFIGASMTNCNDECSVCEELQKEYERLENENVVLQKEVDEKNAELDDLAAEKNAIREQGLEASEEACASLRATLMILLEAQFIKIVDSIQDEPLDERIEAYVEGLDTLFPEHERGNGFDFRDPEKCIIEAICAQYDAYMDVLYEAFDYIDAVDSEFIQKFREHVSDGNTTAYLDSTLDILLMIYTLMQSGSKEWVLNWPDNAYTKQLMNLYDRLVLGNRYTKEVTGLSNAICTRTRTNVTGLAVVNIEHIRYTLLFRSCCSVKHHIAALHLVRHTRKCDGYFIDFLNNDPDVNEFWEWYAKCDLRLQSLYKKINDASVLRDTPLYRRINVLKLNGSIK